MKKLIAATAVLLLSASPTLADCHFTNEAGDHVVTVQENDFDFYVVRADRIPNYCFVVRGEQGASAECQNGIESDFFYTNHPDLPDATLLVFDRDLWWQVCT